MGKSYGSGPIQDSERRCTDKFCLVVFVMLSFVIFSITLYTCMNKGIPNLTTPMDSDGKFCGVDKAGYPYLYFVSPHPDSIQVRVCVSQCPKQAQSLLNCSFNSKVQNCTQNANLPNGKNIQVYGTQLYFNRICLPQPQKIRQQIFRSLNVTISNEHFQQLTQNYQLILLAIPGSMLITLILMIVIRFTACFSIYLVGFVIIGALLFAAYFFFYSSLFMTNDQLTYFNLKQNIVYKVLAGVCVALSFLVMIAFCCFKNRINIAVKMIKASARFVNQHGYLIFLSVFKLMAILIFLALWIVELWGLMKFKQMMFSSYKITLEQHLNTAVDSFIVGLHVFYLMWGICFISQSCTFIISGVTANWYFDKQSVCCSSFNRYTNYHSGSVCAGSFLIALFGFLKLLYEWLKPNAQKEDSILGQIAKFCDCLCCICVSYIFSLVNRGAYTFIHLAGRPYCESTFKILSLRTSQPVLIGVMVFMEIVFSLILRLEIAALTVGAGYLALIYMSPNHQLTQNPFLTLVCIGLIGLVIGEMFVSVYIQAADTIAVCFLIDKQYGDDNGHCPDELKDYLQEIKKNDGFID